MATERSDEGAQAAGSGTLGSLVPWNQIPRFVPGETDVQVYSKKLQFLRELWPTEYLDQLAPRAAMLVDGVGFQKVSRLDPSKLKSKDGVQYLVEALGGEWGRIASEAKFEMFERALYLTVQKGDESNNSYLARHDAAFEELMTQKVKLEDVRAYVLLRQSVLSSEDRKKIILDCSGELDYDTARKSIRLLGSKFFQELQTQGKTSGRTKTYDVNHLEEDSVFLHEEDEPDEDTVMQYMLDAGDEDACFIQEFEEQVLVACQESPDLSACFTSYQEARQRLRDKAKSRGFWPLTSSKGKGKGKKGKTGGGGKGLSYAYAGGRRRSLADRIANSTCRRCGQPGHWKRECPMAAASTPGGSMKKGPENESFTGILQTDDTMTAFDDQIGPAAAGDVLDDLPEGAVLYAEDWQDLGINWKLESVQNVLMGDEGYSGDSDECCFLALTQWSKNLSQKLFTCCRKHDVPCVATAAMSPEVSPAVNDQPGILDMPAESILSAEEADDEAIIDTGASRAVIGTERLKRLMGGLPDDVRKRVMKVPTEGVVFKFGNAGRLTSDFAILLPRAKKGWLRIEVVPGHTPFLISSAILKGLKGVVDVEGKVLVFRETGQWVPLVNVRKNLLGVKVVDLLRQAPSAPAHILCAPTSRSNAAAAYLDRMLTTPVDDSLMSNRTHGDLPQALMRPPDINTLTDWGYLKAPSGKHATKTFAAIYEVDQGYVNQMWNRRGVSSWVRSFQMYSRARRAASEESKRRLRISQPQPQSMSQMPMVPLPRQDQILAQCQQQKKELTGNPRSNMPQSSGSAQGKEAVSPTGLEEWTKIPVDTPVPTEVNKGKRNLIESEQDMNIQPDAAKVGHLQMQIAVLQRELQKELKGSASDPNSKTS
eukprot:s1765_g6.t1